MINTQAVRELKHFMKRTANMTVLVVTIEQCNSVHRQGKIKDLKGRKKTMARPAQVTRTFTTTTASVLCVNIEDGTTKTLDIVLPRTYKDERTLNKAIHEMMKDDPNIKPVHVVNTVTTDRLLAMSESDFIKYATEVPNRETRV